MRTLCLALSLLIACGDDEAAVSTATSASASGGASASSTASSGGMGGGAGGSLPSGDIDIADGRFVRDGAPFFPVGNFLSSENGAGPRTHVYLSDDISDGDRDHMIAVAVGNGYNAFSVYTYNENDYSGEAITPYASGFGGAFDEAKLDVWEQRLQALIDAGLTPIVWLVPDDAPDIHAAPVAELQTYFERMVSRFDALPLLWIMALEADEYWGGAQIDELGTHLATLTTRPIGIHQLPGGTDHMTAAWADFGAYQYGFGLSWQEVFDDTVSVVALLGEKPLIAMEYDLDDGDNDDRLGLAGAFGGARGVGNGAPMGLAAFMESLPAQMTSSRDDTHAYLDGAGTHAEADMNTLTFTK